MKKRLLFIVIAFSLLTLPLFSKTDISYKPPIGFDLSYGGLSGADFDLESGALNMRVNRSNSLTLPIRAGLNVGTKEGSLYSAFNLSAGFRYEYIFDFALVLGAEAGYSVNFFTPYGTQNYLYIDGILGLKEFDDALSISIKGGAEWEIGTNNFSYRFGLSILYYLNSKDEGGEQSPSTGINNALTAESYMDDARYYNDPYQEYMEPALALYETYPYGEMP